MDMPTGPCFAGSGLIRNDPSDDLGGTPLLTQANTAGQLSSLQALRLSDQRLLPLATADEVPGTVTTYGRIMAKRDD
jgi:hypothetical protein